MKVEERTDYPQAVIITLQPHVFGGVQAVEFTAKVRELAEQGKRWFLVDFSQVEVINSSGLGMLVSGLTSLRKFGAALVLVNVPEKIRHLLTITHLDRVFEQFASIEQALQRFAEQQPQ